MSERAWRSTLATRCQQRTTDRQCGTDEGNRADGVVSQCDTEHERDDRDQIRDERGADRADPTNERRHDPVRKAGTHSTKEHDS